MTHNSLPENVDEEK